MGAMQTSTDRAPSHTSMTRLEVVLFALLLLSSSLGYIDRQTATVVSPTLKAEFGLKDEQWGWTNSAFYLSYFASSILGGIWVDRVGVRTGLLVCVGLWSVAAAGHALAVG